MDSKSLIRNTFWRLAERFGAQGVTVFVSVVLARLLDPKIYGSVAIVTVITSFLQVFLEGGFGSALIQKKDADDLDFSSVFYFSVVFSVLLYFLLFFISPWVAGFYQMPELTSILRVLGLNLVIFSVKSVEQAYVSRNMLFRKFFFSTLGGTVGAAVIGIGLAYLGYGVWALVLQHLFNMFIDTVVLWFTVEWRPKRIFSWKRLRVLLTFGWKMLLSGILNTISSNIYQLLIGKVYTPSDLAYFNQGDKYSQVFVKSINTSIDSVLFPTLSKAQNNTLIVKDLTRKVIKVSTYVIIPAMMGVAVCAKPLVNLILTSKWLPCVPYLRIFCFVYAFFPVHTANLNAIEALGRSDLFLKLEIIKELIGIGILASTIWFGPMIMAYSFLFSSVIFQIVNAWPNKKLLNYSYLDQVKDMLPQLFLSGLMGILVYFVSLFGLTDVITLIIQIPLGVVIYIVGSKVLKIDSYYYILSVCRMLLSKKHASPIEYEQ